MTRAALALFAVAALAGCGEERPPTVQRPEIVAPVADCPDPEDRQRLESGSTFRDLAASRLEALDGWERCAFAAQENAR
mgnify:CR=1 FL=1